MLLLYLPVAPLELQLWLSWGTQSDAGPVHSLFRILYGFHFTQSQAKDLPQDQQDFSQPALSSPNSPPCSSISALATLTLLQGFDPSSGYFTTSLHLPITFFSSLLSVSYP